MALVNVLHKINSLIPECSQNHTRNCGYFSKTDHLEGVLIELPQVKLMLYETVVITKLRF